MVRVTQCCCGCTLKTGVIILGIVNAIGGLGSLITGSIDAATPTWNVRQYAGAFVALNVVMAVLGGIMLVVAICLIIGAHNDNPVLLVPWMVYAAVFLVMNTITLIVLAAFSFSMLLIPLGFSIIIATLVFILLEIYFIIVVYSLYRELKGTAPTAQTAPKAQTAPTPPPYRY